MTLKEWMKEYGLAMNSVILALVSFAGLLTSFSNEKQEEKISHLISLNSVLQQQIDDLDRRLKDEENESYMPLIVQLQNIVNAHEKELAAKR